MNIENWKIVHLAGPLGFVFSIALLVASPVIFYMLSVQADSSKRAEALLLQNRAIECDMDTIHRRSAGLEPLPICAALEVR